MVRVLGDGVSNPWMLATVVVLAVDTLRRFLLEVMMGEAGGESSVPSVCLVGVVTEMDLVEAWPMSRLGVTLAGVSLELQCVARGEVVQGDSTSRDTALLGVLLGVLNTSDRCGD